MAEHDLTLAGDFPASTDDAWLSAVEKALAGRPFDKVMRTSSLDGIKLEALYTKDTARVSPQPRFREGLWDIVTPHLNPDARATNDAVLEDLARGATALSLKFQAGTETGIAVDDLSAALNGVYLDLARIHLLPGEAFSDAWRQAQAVFSDADCDAADISGSLGIDPIGTLASTGRLGQTAEKALQDAAAIASDATERFPKMKAFVIDGSVYHSAGASEAQELALVLSTAVAYLRAMEAAGMDLATAFSTMRVSLACDADLFLTIAKLRAFRRLWAHLGTSCGISDVPCEVGAVSALRMYTKRDPWVNILRGTAACFAAGVAGADDITVMPHDCQLGMSAKVARRIARTIQIVLQEESNLAQVADPAAGAYSVETITSDLSDKTWKIFRKIESEGGALSQLRVGAVQASLDQTWQQRRTAVARRKTAITGVSEFPDLFEKPLNVDPHPDRSPGLTSDAGEEISPLNPHRLSEEFEMLRDRSDALLEKTGARPSIFLANLGDAAAYTARATFAKNFFEAGGIEAKPFEGTTEAGAMVGGFNESGASVAVLCGRDEDYEQHAIAVAKALKAAGCKRLLLAGKPSNSEELKAAGVDDLIFIGCDVIETLDALYSQLGGDQ